MVSAYHGGLRARRPERQQQLDQVQHVDGAVVVDILGFAAGQIRLTEADEKVHYILCVDHSIALWTWSSLADSSEPDCLVSGSCPSGHGFAPGFLQTRLAAMPLPFASTSPPLGCAGDFTPKLTSMLGTQEREPGLLLAPDATQRGSLNRGVLAPRGAWRTAKARFAVDCLDRVPVDDRKRQARACVPAVEPNALDIPSEECATVEHLRGVQHDHGTGLVEALERHNTAAVVEHIRRADVHEHAWQIRKHVDLDARQLAEIARVLHGCTRSTMITGMLGKMRRKR